ncbi:MAG TPA: zinc-dependent alcohol dehydrogenase family protein [Candidatus Nanopelagicaceae bacterium]|nr:zinc-dependent alcohol dehydrogenase family protein [Candidatus Nanopelagicaceae bacterium]
MRGIYFEQFHGPVGVKELPDPTLSPGGVVIRVDATGICRSDWHAWAGHDQEVSLPHVPGHELAGTIAAVGLEVRQFALGDRVTVPFVCGCGRCEFCLQGNSQVCPTQTQPGFTHWGSFAEFVAIDNADFNLIRIPEAVSMVAAASLGCRFATAFRGLSERAKVQPEEWVAVIGAGGVGLSTVMIAKAFGARVIAVDVAEEPLDRAQEIGADITINGRETDPIEAILQLTGGAHIGIDAVGSEVTARQSILSLRRRGRHVQIGLLPSIGGLPRIPMDRVISYELDLLGSHGMAAKDYPRMLSLIEQNLLRPDLLVSQVVNLEQAAVQLVTLDQHPANGMTVLDPWLR